MVGLAESVTGIECATPLEAEVRELRLIAEHKPRYNRRSRFPEKAHYLKLTREAWPRLSLVRRVVDDGADYVGPFSSKRTAEKCLAALHETFPLRQCTQRLGRQPSVSPCVLAEMGRCLSPCDGSVDATTYAAVVRQLRDNLLSRPDDVVELITRRMATARRRRALRGGRGPSRPARGVRARGRPHPTAHGPDPDPPAGGRPPRGRPTRRGPLGGPRRTPRPARRGRSHPARRGRPPLRRRARRQWRVGPRAVPVPAPAATAEETERILRWLEAPGLRLIEVDGEWTCPVGGATRHLALHDAVTQSRLDLVPFDDRRDLPTPPVRCAEAPSRVVG